MMISPETYADMHKDDSWEELIKERKRLLREINKFEREGTPEGIEMVCPGPDVRYFCNLEYLAELCKLTNEKFLARNNDWGEDEEE